MKNGIFLWKNNTYYVTGYILFKSKLCSSFAYEEQSLQHFRFYLADWCNNFCQRNRRIILEDINIIKNLIVGYKSENDCDRFRDKHIDILIVHMLCIT